MKRCTGLFIFLLLVGYLHAQDQLADNLRQQFHNYQTSAPQEKIFVHTDKTFYLAGETVWFKLYAVDASFHKPLGASSIGYVEILNEDLKAVVQTKISLTSGSGNGSCILPAFLNSGNYIFRAYTNWMKNFSPDFYYQQTIHIVNTLKTTAAVSLQQLPPAIRFFPEGGNWITGYQTKIAFKAVDGEGRGIDCNGIIVNQKNDTVTSFKSLYRGMGNLQLRAEKNTDYYAVFRFNGSLIKQKLPDTEEHGLAMNISSSDGEKYKVTVHASPELNNTNVYLFAHTRQVNKNLQVAVIKDGAAIFLLDQKDLGDGISTITIFDHLRQPVCERLVFKRPVGRLLIQAKTDQLSYKIRKPVLIDLATISSAGVPLSGNLSLSVFLIDSLQHIPEQNIFTYLYLGSDLKGKIESPEYYFNDTSKAADEAMDNLLLTQGWRRFKWSEVFEIKKPVYEFLPELEGAVVNGKVINKLTGNTVAQTDALFSVPGADYAFNSATSNEQGIVHFAFKDIYNNNAIVVQPALQKDSNYRIDITNSYSDKFSSEAHRALTLSKTQENELLNRSISNQVENTYGMNKKRRYAELPGDTISFYGAPDKLYYLEDFTRFQTMEEVMREYVEDVRVRKEGDKFTFKVRNRLFGTYFEENPLILLDGIPVSDASRIIALDPQKVKKIEVVTHQYYIGSAIYEGIVNVKSYSSELGATQIDPAALVVEFDGLQKQREFYSPVYVSKEEQESHMPDFRNVLSWSPKITTAPNGTAHVSFYTSDLKGKFAVVIQGITADGLPGKGVAQFDVTDSE